MIAVSEDTLRAIDALYFDYATAIDEDIARWPDFFTLEATYRVTSRENYDRGLPLAHILCTSHGMIRDRAMAVESTTVYAARFMRHAITNIRVTAEVDGAIAARANFTVYETGEDTISRLFAVGRSIDTIAREGDAFKFRHKTCVLDSNVVIGSLIYPI